MNNHRGLIISGAKLMSPCCNFIWVVLFLMGWFILTFIAQSKCGDRQTYSLPVWVSILFAGNVPRAGGTLVSRHSACMMTPRAAKNAEPHGRQQPREEWLQFFMCLVKWKCIKTLCQVSKKCTSTVATPSSTRCALSFVVGRFKEQKPGNCLAKLAFIFTWK